MRFVFLAFFLLATATVADQKQNSWLIWSEGKANLYKVQDGTCSVYVAFASDSGMSFKNADSVAIAVATGQGCH